MEKGLFDDIEHYLRYGEQKERLLTSEQVDFIIVQFATARGDKGFTEEEAVKLIKWIEKQLVGEALVQLYLDGFVYLDDPTGAFDDDVVVKLTEEGVEVQNRMFPFKES